MPAFMARTSGQRGRNSFRCEGGPHGGIFTRGVSLGVTLEFGFGCFFQKLSRSEESYGFDSLLTNNLTQLNASNDPTHLPFLCLNPGWWESPSVNGVGPL